MSVLTIVVSVALGGLTVVLLRRRWTTPPGPGRRTGRVLAVALAGSVVALVWPIALLALPVLVLVAARGDDTTPRRTPPPASSPRRAERPAAGGRRPYPRRHQQYRYDNYGYDSSGKSYHYYYH